MSVFLAGAFQLLVIVASVFPMVGVLAIVAWNHMSARTVWERHVCPSCRDRIPTFAHGMQQHRQRTSSARMGGLLARCSLRTRRTVLMLDFVSGIVTGLALCGFAACAIVMIRKAY